MNAPIDIVIDIINRKIKEVEEVKYILPNYKDGMIDAYEGLVREFEEFKKLFS